MTADDQNREHGVEFGPLADELESEDYPMDNEELLERYGDLEVEVKGRNQTVAELVGPLGDTTFENFEGVRRSVVGMVDESAVGREGYSDRGGADTRPDRDEESV